MFNPYNMPNMNNIMAQFEQFKRTVQGNPQQVVQQLINTGRMTPQQFQQLKQMADQLSRMMPR